MFYKKVFLKSLDHWPTFLAKDATFDFNDAILYIAHNTELSNLNPNYYY